MASTMVTVPRRAAPTLTLPLTAVGLAHCSQRPAWRHGDPNRPSEPIPPSAGEASCPDLDHAGADQSVTAIVTVVEETMSTTDPQGSASGDRVVVAAGRLWAGGVATACVAALVAAVCVLLFGSVLSITLIRPPLLVPLTDSLALNYMVTAFVLALAATGIAHLLSVTTPRPRVFFGWVVGLVTLGAMVVPFVVTGSVASKICTALVNLAIGIAIGGLLTAVLSRTVTDADRSWQRR